MSSADRFRTEAAKRILIKDGAYGTQVQQRRLQEADYRGALDLRRTSAATTTCST
jgi:5-methyltetrahydrofolate--homocysteine methyltransferase